MGICKLTAMLLLSGATALQAQPQLLKDMIPGPAGQTVIVMHPYQSRLYFAADDGINGRELWSTDGSPAQTQAAFDLNPGLEDSFPALLGEFAGRLYFAADDGIEGDELWSIDGSHSPSLHDIRPGPESSNPNWVGVVGSRLMLRASDAFNTQELFGLTGGGTPEFWVNINQLASSSSPGLLLPLSANSALLSAIAAGPPNITAAPHLLVDKVATEIGISGSDHRVRVVNGFWPVSSGYLFFGVDSEASEPQGDILTGTEPWLIDLGLQTAQLVADINPGFESSVSATATQRFLFNGELYFGAKTAASGVELWASDGTAANTRQLVDILPGPGDAAPFSFHPYQNQLYFGVKTPNGPQLWKTDGVVTSWVATIDSNPNRQAPWPGVIFDGYLLFRGDTDAEGLEYWATDGNTARLVADINPGEADGVVRPLSSGVVNDTLVFAADDGQHGLEVWRLEPGYLDALFDTLFSDGFE